jgi:hypothetical protein
MPTARLKILALALIPCSFVSAATPMVPSLHLSLATAQGDFREEMGSKVGVGAALSLTIPVTSNLSFRPILSFQSFPTLNNQYTYKSARYSDRGDEEARWSAWSYGADCLYRPGGPQGRLYFLAGAHLKVWRLHGFGTYTTQDSLNATRSYSVDDTSTKNEPAAALGLGYTFNRHLSLEARSVLASYRSLSYNTLEMAFVLSY